MEEVQVFGMIYAKSKAESRMEILEMLLMISITSINKMSK